MKTKNILIYLIVLVMLFSAIPIVSVAAENDISEKEGLLRALQIVTERKETVTRGDFAEIIVKAMNMGEVANTETELSFVDVDKTHPKYSYIAAAKMLGLMNGYSDSIFSLDKEITAGEAISVVVWALGDLRVKNGMKAYDAARDNKLLKDMNGATGAALSYDQMVILIYNYLHANVLDDVVLPYRGHKPGKGDSVLEKFFGIKIYEGIVYATNYTAIKGSPTEEKYVRIGDVTFMDEQGITTDMIGNYVRGYYKDDESRALIYAFSDKRRNNVEIIPLDETDNIGDQLKYNKKSYRYDSKTTFIYNSELVTDPSVLATAFSGSGTVKLINNNYDSVYDAIIIEKYTVGEIEGVNAYSEYIKIKGNSKIAYEEYRASVFYDSNGSFLMPEDLIAGNVVCIALPVSKNGAIKVVRCDSIGSAVIGVIDAGEKIVTTQEGMEYKALCSLSELKLGEEYELYLDRFGNLVYASKAVGTRRFGYVIEAGMSTSLGGAFQIRILDNSGEIKFFEQSDKVKVRLTDGSFAKLKGQEILNALTSANDGYMRQPILYLLNYDGTLKELWLISDNLNVEFHNLDSLLLDLSESERGAMHYRKGPVNIGGKYQMSAETVVYRVPKYDLEIEDEKLDLEVANAYAYLTSGTAYNTKSIRKFGDTTDGTNIITAIAFEAKSLKADVVVFEETPGLYTEFGPSTLQPMVVTDIRYARDEEDEEYIKVTGYTAGGMETSFNYYDKDGSGLVGIVNAKRTAASMDVNDATYAPISLGDIIKHNSKKARANKNHIEIYYRNDMDNDGKSDPISYSNLMQHQTTQSTYRFYDYARVTPATVVSKFDNIVRLEVCDLRNSGLDSGIIETREEVFSVGSIPVYIYSKSGRSIRKMTSDIITEGDTFLIMSNGGLAQFAVYYE